MRIIETKNEAIKLKGLHNRNDDQLRGVADPLPAHNFAWLFVGTPGTGKSSLLSRLLTEKAAYRGKFDYIYYFSPSVHTLPDEFRSKLAPDRLFTSLDELPEILESFKGPGEDKVLFVLDDCVADIKTHTKELMNALFNRRHYSRGISFAIITQKLRAIPLQLRTAIDALAFFSLRNKRECDACFEDYLQNFLDETEFKALLKHIANSGAHPFLFARIDEGKVYNKFNSLELVE